MGRKVGGTVKMGRQLGWRVRTRFVEVDKGGRYEKISF